MSAGNWEEVWDVVREIPAGKVMNYGGVARLLSRPLSARAVGWAMADCPDDVPWHRVVNVHGVCSTDSVAGAEVLASGTALFARGTPPS